MNLLLRSLSYAGPNRCVAEFATDPEQRRIVGEFLVDEHGGIPFASSRPDVFRDFEGSADDQRRIVAAVIAFCRVASAPT